MEWVDGYFGADLFFWVVQYLGSEVVVLPVKTCLFKPQKLDFQKKLLVEASGIIEAGSCKIHIVTEMYILCMLYCKFCLATQSDGGDIHKLMEG